MHIKTVKSLLINIPFYTFDVPSTFLSDYGTFFKSYTLILENEEILLYILLFFSNCREVQLGSGPQALLLITK